MTFSSNIHGISNAVVLRFVIIFSLMHLCCGFCHSALSATGIFPLLPHTTKGRQGNCCKLNVIMFQFMTMLTDIIYCIVGMPERRQETR